MIPMIAASAAANIGGGLIGNLLSAGDKQAQTDQLQQIYARYANLEVPDTEKMRLALEDYKSAGTLTPTTEAATQISGTEDALQDITVDPRLRQAQLGQLQALSKLGETGLSPVELAQLGQLNRQTESDAKARSDAMLQQQDARGVGSSEAALMARMQQGQSAANRQQTAAENQAAMAFQNALQARASAAGLGATMENTQYAQAKNIADALNNREMFNAQQDASTKQRNVDRFNLAQASNLQNAQNISNQNVGSHNQQQQYNKELEQRKFDNTLNKYAGMSGAQQNVGNAYGSKAAATQNMWSNIGAGAGNAFTAYGMNQAKASTPTAGSPDVANGDSTFKKPGGYLS